MSRIRATLVEDVSATSRAQEVGTAGGRIERRAVKGSGSGGKRTRGRQMTRNTGQHKEAARGTRREILLFFSLRSFP